MHYVVRTSAVALIWATLVPAADLPLSGRAILGNSASPHARLKALDLDDVRWTGGFWAERFDVVRNNMLPAIWHALADPNNGAQYASFLKAAGRGGDALNLRRLNWWSDGDVYKTVEAMALVYASTKDPQIDRRMDEVIAVIKACQAADGYISTPIDLKGAKRWQNLSHHELYNMGHLMTAACVHYRATGKKNFLDIATNLGDYLYGVFVPRPKELAHFGFNPSNIMGAVELYRTTGNRKYLDLAQIFVDMRGSAPGGDDVNQTRVPLRSETEAVGHAVTGNYLYAGATDVYAETGERALAEAVQRIWDDVTTRKMYITGAVGNLYKGPSRRGDIVHEAYGLEYELPNRLAYTETCANIGNAMWNWRLLSLSGDARYGDIMELVLYNSMLSGMGVKGTDFYYNNPLRRWGDELPRVIRTMDPPLRAQVLPCYCCPTNIARTIAGLKDWAYAKSGDAIWVNLYGSSHMDTAVGGGRIALTETTDYPWDGAVTFKVDKAPAGEFTLMLRIPRWAEGATVEAGGEGARNVRAGAYASVRRAWKAGDRIALRLPMQPRLVAANPFVESARNQAAVMRGPLVYAVESPDLPAGMALPEVSLGRQTKFREHFEKDLLGGVMVLDAQAIIRPEGNWAGQLYRVLRPEAARTATISLIPYYAWSNRGMSYMSVWVPLGD
jgi:uncharacterized protein